MSWGFVINDVAGLKPDQTTAMMIHRAAARGHDTWVAGIGDLGVSREGALTARARKVDAGQDESETVDRVVARSGERATVAPGDAILLRCSPGRDTRGWVQQALLDLARVAVSQGAVVVSNPEGLARAASKAYLLRFGEEVRPRTVLSQDAAELRAFVESEGIAVVKPLAGTRGRDVFLVRPEDTNLAQILDVLTRDGLAIAQEYLPDAPRGDVRLLMLEGEPLRVGDEIAVVRRVPGARDFRSNVFVGGTPAPAEMTDAMWRTARVVGPQLRADGIFLAGLDLIGHRAVEINVFSAGGAWDANRFHGVDFLGPVLDALARLQRLRQASSSSP